MKGIQEIEDARQTFRKFEELMRQLIAVPRAELRKSSSSTNGRRNSVGQLLGEFDPDA